MRGLAICQRKEQLDCFMCVKYQALCRCAPQASAPTSTVIDAALPMPETELACEALLHLPRRSTSTCAILLWHHQKAAMPTTRAVWQAVRDHSGTTSLSSETASCSSMMIKGDTWIAAASRSSGNFWIRPSARVSCHQSATRLTTSAEIALWSLLLSGLTTPASGMQSQLPRHPQQQ